MSALEKVKSWWDFLQGNKTAIGGVIAGIGTLGMYVYPPAAPLWAGLQTAGGLIAGVGAADKLRRGEWKLPFLKKK